MSKKIYNYFFPENKKFKTGLMIGDISVIACNTGYKEGTIKKMLGGQRKLPNSVKEECFRIAEINNKKLKK